MSDTITLSEIKLRFECPTRKVIIDVFNSRSDAKRFGTTMCIGTVKRFGFYAERYDKPFSVLIHVLVHTVWHV